MRSFASDNNSGVHPLVMEALNRANIDHSLGYGDDKWTEATKGEAWDEWCERWEIIKTDWTQLSLTPGADATQLNFAWYSVIGEENPIVKVSKNYDMSDEKIFEGK